MYRDSKALLLVHDVFERKHGNRISMLSFQINNELTHTKHSKTFKVTLAKPPKTQFILEKVEKSKLLHPDEFLQANLVLHQINHPNILKVHTIFEEEGFIFVLKEDADFVVSQSPHKFQNLSHTTICDLFSDMVDILRHFNALGLSQSTLDFRPKHLYVSADVLKVGKLMSFEKLYNKPQLGFFSVPESESSKDKIEVWNLGMILLGLSTGFEVFPVARSSPPSELTIHVSKRSDLSDELKILVCASVCLTENRITFEELRRSPFIKTKKIANFENTSNSFSVEPKDSNLFTDFPEIHKQSLVSFEISNNTSSISPNYKKLHPKNDKNELNELFLRKLQTIESRLQSMSDFRHRVEKQQCIFDKQTPNFGDKERSTIEIILEQHQKSVT